MATIKGDPKDYVIRQPGLDYFLTIKIGQGASTHTTYFNPGGLVIDDENINGKMKREVRKGVVELSLSLLWLW
jgi:hypothetical protein